MKNIVLGLLILLLSACAPAQAPDAIATEIPATEYPVESPVPAPTQQLRANVNFSYTYTSDITRDFFNGTDVAFENIEFHRLGDEWEKKELKPHLND